MAKPLLRGEKQRWLFNVARRCRAPPRCSSKKSGTAHSGLRIGFTAREATKNTVDRESAQADAVDGLADKPSVHRTANCSKQRDAADATTALSSSRIKQLTRSSSPSTGGNLLRNSSGACPPSLLANKAGSVDPSWLLAGPDPRHRRGSATQRHCPPADATIFVVPLSCMHGAPPPLPPFEHSYSRREAQRTQQREPAPAVCCALRPSVVMPMRRSRRAEENTC